MSGFEALLRLQEHDTAIEQLEHRLGSLPERAALADVRAALAATATERVAVQARRDELARDQKRIEDEVALVEAKATEVDGTLYSGSVTSPKELQALQDEFAALKRRQAELEDRVIEVMEAAEPVDEELAGLDSHAGTLGADEVAAVSALAQAEATVGAELETARAERSAIESEVPADLLAEYERLRSQLGGIAVARLVGANCHGCHLALAAANLDEVRHQPPDALVHCPECGRILVR